MQSCSQIITTNKPTPNFLQAGCPSCRPTNSVRALKGNDGEKNHCYVCVWTVNVQKYLTTQAAPVWPCKRRPAQPWRSPPPERWFQRTSPHPSSPSATSNCPSDQSDCSTSALPTAIGRRSQHSIQSRQRSQFRHHQTLVALAAVWQSAGLIIGRLQVQISVRATSHQGLLSLPSLQGR